GSFRRRGAGRVKQEVPLPLALASMDYLKQDRVLDWLDRSNGYDLVILDEAHHYSDTGAEEYDRADASQRRKLALVLARAADALLLLSATRTTATTARSPPCWSCSTPPSRTAGAGCGKRSTGTSSCDGSSGT